MRQGQGEGAHAATPGEKVHVQDAEVTSLISICDNVRAQVRCRCQQQRPSFSAKVPPP